jgi:ABC-2 type transport system permease protein
MKKYLSLMRMGVMEQLQFRMGFITKIIGNLIYVMIIYFLWKSIFASAGTDVVNGMTFADTMVYLVLASSLFSIMEVYLVWETSRNIQTGKIVNDIIKPVNYRAFMYFPYFGNMIMDFIITFIPTFILVYFLSGMSIPLGLNLVYFFVSFIMSFLINLSIDFFVGGIILYTMSTWGINIMKEVIVLLLSGATIPLAFFPEPLKTIVMYLPFQAVYNSPLLQLIGDHSYTERLEMLGVQLFWVVAVYVISELFWRKSLKQITVNGG